MSPLTGRDFVVVLQRMPLREALFSQMAEVNAEQNLMADSMSSDKGIDCSDLGCQIKVHRSITLQVSCAEVDEKVVEMSRFKHQKFCTTNLNLL